jgi:signal peptidase I
MADQSTKGQGSSTTAQSANPKPQENSKAAKPAQPKRNPPPATEPKDTIREIVETVVFVVVLVLLLKSFVAEAYVIPTGSMAETLYGYQKIVKCPQCGYEFPVNCSGEIDPQQPPPRPVVGCTCPNCRYDIDFAKEDMKPTWHTGDRVLVAKSVYDLQMLPGNKPKRRDVVVFKYPKEPQQRYTPTNYIKRLIGLPKETIGIHYGKLYVYPDLEYDDSKVDPLKLWEDRYMHENQALDLFKDGKFRMLRKTANESIAVRRRVFDNDYQPKDLVGKVPPRWQASGSWQLDTPDVPKRFEHAVGENKEFDWLRYHHLIPDRSRQNYQRELVTDFLGYNTYVEVVPDQFGRMFEGPHKAPAQNWVGDLMLEADVEVQQAQGELVF